MNREDDRDKIRRMHYEVNKHLKSQYTELNHNKKAVVKKKYRKFNIYIFLMILSVIIIVFSLNYIFKHKKETRKTNEEQSIGLNTNKTEEEKVRVEPKEKIEEEKKTEESKYTPTHESLPGIEKRQKETEKYVFNEKAQEEIDKIYLSGKKVAYLTFDDGPGPQTEELLDLLKKEGIPATFFVIGNKIDGNEDIIRRQFDEGHCIGNHSYTHNYSRLYSGKGKVFEEYDQAEKKLKKILGDDFQNRIFRFPGGSVGGEFHNQKKRIGKELNKKGIAYIDWNCLTDDSVGADTKKEQLAAFYKSRDGWHPLIVLQHDKRNDNLIEVTKEIIKHLKEQNYEFKNFNDILLKERQANE